MMLPKPSLCGAPASSQAPGSGSKSVHLSPAAVLPCHKQHAGVINHGFKAMWFLPFLSLHQRAAKDAGVRAMVMNRAHKNK